MTDGMYPRYDYAWQTPGWTVQNPAIPSNVSMTGYPDPGLPSDVSRVRLHGRFLDFESGRGLEGVFRLRVRDNLVHVATGQRVMNGEFKPIRFREDGFSLWLPATNDPSLSPEFLYEGLLTVRGEATQFTFALPAEVAEVDVQTLL